MTTIDVNKMIMLWEQVFNVEGLDNSSDFFDLGGHSLLAWRILQSVEEDCGVELPIDLLFNYPTIGEFTAAVYEAHGNNG
ncbi:MAG: acyl carrier protein [Nostoc sp. DedQUE05]|uniref:acyl carrier protein n=1 Tax=Nostoc sp. DedQUE05 TaxID=3075391 RepID=UPI002AD243F4|nr:acyl carrier protein [Nostoc sp. DedQUE05]MDZ8091509.1 acyl carrier protein [Nostoc sp. DedQUE05]